MEVENVNWKAESKIILLPHRDEAVGPRKLNKQISPFDLNDLHKFLFRYRPVGKQQISGICNKSHKSKEPREAKGVWYAEMSSDNEYAL